MTEGAGLRQSHFGSGYDAGKARLQAEVEQLRAQIAALQKGTADSHSSSSSSSSSVDQELLRSENEWLKDQIAHLTGYADGLKRGSDLHEQRRGELEKQLAAQAEVRPIVRAFACQMELTLRANDHKGGWDGCSKQYLTRRLHEECRELVDAVISGGKSKSDRMQIRAEATDVANFAMMIADVFGDLARLDAADVPAASTTREVEG